MNNMDTFYNLVHDLNKFNLDSTLNRYRHRINKELVFFNKNIEVYFKNKIVLDFGTGFQGLIAYECGAKIIIIIDINKDQINFNKQIIKELNLNENKFHHINLDLNSEDLSFIPEFDIALNFGILNHLEAPDIFIKKIANKMNPNGEILVRCYNVNSTTRRLISEIRNIILNNDIEINELLSVYFDKYSLTAPTSYQLRDMIDDLYTPILKNFDVKGIELINNGFSLNKDENTRFLLTPYNIKYVQLNWLNNSYFGNKYVFNICRKKICIMIIKLYQILRYNKYYDVAKMQIISDKSEYMHLDFLKSLKFWYTFYAYKQSMFFK